MFQANFVGLVFRSKKQSRFFADSVSRSDETPHDVADLLGDAITMLNKPPTFLKKQ